MNARQYRHSARAHAAKAAMLLAGRPGMTQTEKEQALKAAVSHLGNAMAHASAAVALTELAGQAVDRIDVTKASAQMIEGLEAMLTTEQPE